MRFQRIVRPTLPGVSLAPIRATALGLKKASNCGLARLGAMSQSPHAVCHNAQKASVSDKSLVVWIRESKRVLLLLSRTDVLGISYGKSH